MTRLAKGLCYGRQRLGLQRGKKLREDADYYNEWSKIGAEEMVRLAEEFLDAIRSILNF
jgi:hypothetical protein